MEISHTDQIYFYLPYVDAPVQDVEVKEIDEDKHKDDIIDIEKLPEDTSTDIEDDINLDAIKEKQISEGNEKKEEASEESEIRENVDEMQEKLDEANVRKEETDVVREKEMFGDKKEDETEIEGEDNVDDEGGSMFGSIWSGELPTFSIIVCFKQIYT